MGDEVDDLPPTSHANGDASGWRQVLQRAGHADAEGEGPSLATRSSVLAGGDYRARGRVSTAKRPRRRKRSGSQSGSRQAASARAGRGRYRPPPSPAQRRGRHEETRVVGRPERAERSRL